MKKSVYIIIAVILLCATLTTSVIAIVNCKKNRENELAFQQIKKVVYHMSYSEVVDLLGEPIDSGASGFIKTEWKLVNGSKIWIWFSSPEKDGEPLVIGFFVE